MQFAVFPVFLYGSMNESAACRVLHHHRTWLNEWNELWKREYFPFSPLHFFLSLNRRSFCNNNCQMAVIYGEHRFFYSAINRLTASAFHSRTNKDSFIHNAFNWGKGKEKNKTRKVLQLDDNDHFITLCRRLMAEIGCETFLQGVNRNHQRRVLKSHQDLFSPARATSFVIGRSSRQSFNFMALEKKEIALNLFFTFTSSASTSDSYN